MKKQLSKILALSLIVVTLFSCKNKENAQSISKIEPYIYEVEVYNELDYDYADEFWAKDNDNWSGGGCSAITKIVEGDRRLIGRNMDLNISENCAYIVRTKAGRYETIGIQYTFRDVSPKFSEVEKNGISEQWSKLLPFYCDDVMNDQGFYIEVNMRHGEYYPNGDDMFAMKGTNPNGERRVHMFELPRYIAENCKTIAEAKEYVKTLDIYSKNNYWNYCFVMADATGAASLLEFCNDDLFETSGIFWFDETPDGIYLEVDGGRSKLDTSYMNEYQYYEDLNYHAIGQTNFFINKYGYLRQDIKSGFGRLKTLQDGIDAVNSRKDMYDLINKVSYSNFYKPYDECKANHFDPRSEQVGEHGPISLSSGVVMNPNLEPYIKELMDAYTEPIRAMTRQEKRAKNEYWESTFTEVVDIKEKAIFVRIYEDDNLKFKINFDGTTRIQNIK